MANGILWGAQENDSCGRTSNDWTRATMLPR